MIDIKLFSAYNRMLQPWDDLCKPHGGHRKNPI